MSYLTSAIAFFSDRSAAYLFSSFSIVLPLWFVGWYQCRCASDRYYITSIAKFVKDYVFIRTLSIYYFLFGVLVGSSGYYIDTHTSTSPLHFDTQHHRGSVLEPAKFYFGTWSVPVWHLVRAILELAGSPFWIGTDRGGGGVAVSLLLLYPPTHKKSGNWGVLHSSDTCIG